MFRLVTINDVLSLVYFQAATDSSKWSLLVGVELASLGDSAKEQNARRMLMTQSKLQKAMDWLAAALMRGVSLINILCAAAKLNGLIGSGRQAGAMICHWRFHFDYGDFFDYTYAPHEGRRSLFEKYRCIFIVAVDIKAKCHRLC